MLRFSQFGLLAAFMALLGTVSAQASEVKSAGVKSAGRSRVEHVAVRGTGDATEIEIQTSGAAVAPDTQVVSDPDRIIIDFPGALPAAELHALELKVNSGALKSIRAGLFFNNPPITRIVLDLAAPRSYHISTEPNATIVKLGAAETAAATAISPTPGSAKLGSAELNSAKLSSAKLNSAKLNSAKLGSAKLSSAKLSSAKLNSSAAIVRRARLQTAAMAASARVVPGPDPMPVVAVPPPAPKPLVTVTYTDGMLRIHSEKATLAQVLYEVQNQTQAEIAIPAGAEQEEVIADIGPAPAREVLASLLNGSPYNFIFVGTESTLERVILTRRDPNIF